ncbi:DUF1223 domain-containing protein [Rhodobacteraceae bacterium KMM 6894]|nr:DUF1223 domain-containing protein [Rhodobacteraceae bacterium KMM 6894]
MRFLLTLILAPYLMVSAALAGDGQRPVVVELFTSQGCSSCPPADALLHDLAARDDVIALALHVDYWDYIGWKDVFGKPANTKRQNGYAKAGKRRMVYTPQMIVNGQQDVVGNRPKDVSALISRHMGQPKTVDLAVTRNGGEITISARSLNGASPLIVQMVRFVPYSEVAITRGENAGHTFAYANVVTDLVELTRWDRTAPLILKVDAPGDAQIAVILQRPGFGQIEAAALVR